MATDQQCIDSTRCWIENVVIAQNFCPFAHFVYVNELIEFSVNKPGSMKAALEQLAQSLENLQSNSSVETSLLIFPEFVSAWEDYLDFLELAQSLLKQLGYEGIFQLASFHPDYCFEGESTDDAANYTNRSPFPMLHILREASLSEQIEHYPDAQQIPENNIVHARTMGADSLRSLLKNCIKK